MKYAGSFGLALVLAVTGLVAACGPSTPEANNPQGATTGEPNATGAPTASQAPTAEPTSAPTSTATSAPTASGTGTATSAPTANPPAAAPVGPPIMATKLADELKKAGFDLAKLPPSISKMDMGAKKKIMPIFVKALGYQDCKGCHVEDVKVRTHNTDIAKHMYDEFVVKMRDDKGAATVFCDSCHQGKPKILNRSDLKAVGKYMDEQYVNHLSQSDKKKNQECGTCHGDTMEMKIFDKLWKVTK